ncbi:MAG TPA: SdpI family protein [Candidatus Baltobacteraceae bacterium]|nr:SdpI family protein [Candidatus Baltobacteraceae bacterium]
MSRKKALLFGLVLALISVGLSAWSYPHAPALIPTHWDAAGHANGYMPKLWGLSVQPALLIGLCVLMLALPKISPTGFRFGQSTDVLNLIVVAVMVVEFVVGVAVVRASVGMAAPSSGFVLVLVGSLFVIIGNYMGKVRKNFFLGIRTPWTLASDEVWLRTNRLAGWLFVLGGIVFIVSGVVSGNSTGVLIGVVSAIVAVPIVYSYVVYKRIEGFEANGS